MLICAVYTPVVASGQSSPPLLCFIFLSQHSGQAIIVGGVGVGRLVARWHRQPLNGVVVIAELNIAGALSVSSDKLLITRGPLVLGVAGQHALDAHADALGALDWAPALVAEKVEADDAVGVDVRVDGDRAVGAVLKCDFGRFCCGCELLLLLLLLRAQPRAKGSDGTHLWGRPWESGSAGDRSGLCRWGFRRGRECRVASR